MNDDLVKRLRDLGKRVSFGHVVPPAGTYMLKAAERVEAMEARIESLEMALREIEEHEILDPPPHYGGSNVSWFFREYKAIRKIANAALEGKDD